MENGCKKNSKKDHLSLFYPFTLVFAGISGFTKPKYGSLHKIYVIFSFMYDWNLTYIYIGWNVIKKFSIGRELELHGIAMQRYRIGFVVFNGIFKKGKNLYFIASMKDARIGIGILLIWESPQCPTLLVQHQCYNFFYWNLFIYR